MFEEYNKTHKVKRVAIDEGFYTGKVPRDAEKRDATLGDLISDVFFTYGEGTLRNGGMTSFSLVHRVDCKYTHCSFVDSDDYVEVIAYATEEDAENFIKTCKLYNLKCVPLYKYVDKEGTAEIVTRAKITKRYWSVYNSRPYIVELYYPDDVDEIKLSDYCDENDIPYCVFKTKQNYGTNKIPDINKDKDILELFVKSRGL